MLFCRELILRQTACYSIEGFLRNLRFNYAMRSWLFGVLIAESVKAAPDPELLAVSAILHDVGPTATVHRSASSSMVPTRPACF
jgi:hypothetical protein